MFDTLVSVLDSGGFPRLRRLYWLIHAGYRSSGSAWPDIWKFTAGDLERLQKGAEEIVRAFGPQLRNFNIASQYSVYQALAERARSIGARFGRSPASWRGERFWCPIGAVVHGEADSCKPGAETEGLGYWIQVGMGDSADLDAS